MVAEVLLMFAGFLEKETKLKWVCLQGKGRSKIWKMKPKQSLNPLSAGSDFEPEKEESFSDGWME